LYTQSGIKRAALADVKTGLPVYHQHHHQYHQLQPQFIYQHPNNLQYATTIPTLANPAQQSAANVASTAATAAYPSAATLLQCKLV
jgi:hypothetical protein